MEQGGRRTDRCSWLLKGGPLCLSMQVAASSARDTLGWVSCSSCGCCRHGWATIPVAAGLPGLWSGGQMGCETL